MNTTMKAQGMYDFIKAQVEAGRTCYLATALRITKIQKKHLIQVRVNGNALEILCGKRWIDYTHTALSAR
jgi:hypothetical protein